MMETRSPLCCASKRGPDSPAPARLDQVGASSEPMQDRTSSSQFEKDSWARTGAGLAVALSLFVSGCGKHRSDGSASSSPALPPATVKVETISPRRLSLTEEVTGTVRSRVAVEIEGIFEIA